MPVSFHDNIVFVNFPTNSYPKVNKSSLPRALKKEAKQFEAIDLIPGEAAFRAYGSTLGELFSNAGRALFSVMGELNSILPKEKRSITLADPSVERLLIDFLSELVYLKDAEAMLFSRFEVSVIKDETYHLSAKLHGEPINADKHKLGVDVKGVTMHRYKFEHLSSGYQAQVVLDI